jgi:hypothetical protein
MEIITPLIPNWIHNSNDYFTMFNLKPEDFHGPVLDCPGGFSTFNKSMHEQDSAVVSVDSMYNLSALDMSKHIELVIEGLADQLESHKKRIHYPNSQVPEDIIKVWRGYADEFLGDYSNGKAEDRYLSSDLKILPFENHQFNLALCPHLLFRNAQDPLPLLKEFLRVAVEVRLYPLLDKNGEVIDTLGPSMLWMQEENLGVEVREIPYRMQQGSNAMLRIWQKECEVDS